MAVKIIHFVPKAARIADHRNLIYARHIFEIALGR